MSQTHKYKIGLDGVARPAISLLEMIPKIIVGFIIMLCILLAINEEPRKQEREALASGVSENLTIDQLKMEHKIEELRETIATRKADMAQANRGIVNGYGLLTPKEERLAEIEMRKNKDETEKLKTQCLDEIDKGNIDFNCPKIVNDEVRK